MSLPVRSNLDLGQNQILNFAIQSVSSDPGSPVAGQCWFRSDLGQLRLYDGTTVQTLAEKSFSLDQFGSPAATVNFNAQGLANLATPVNPADAATKGYVDASALGLSIRDSVVCASPGNVNIASGLVAGVSIDGITVSAGQRVLLANQTTASQNGVYIVAASGAAARSSDLSTSAQIFSGVFVFVETGTQYGATGWIISTQGTITVGSTAITWVQMSASTVYTAGSGLTLTGTSFSVNTDATTIGVISSNLSVKSSTTAGQTLVSAGSGAAAWGTVALGNANAVSGTLALGNGGTGATTAAAARTALACVTKYATTIGNGSSTSFTITHGLGTQDIQVSVYSLTSPYDFTLVEVQNTSTTTCTLVFATAPASNSYRVICIG